MKKFLDRQYGRPWSPPKQAPSTAKWKQPEDVVGTVSGREASDREKRYMRFLKALIAGTRDRKL